MAYYPLSQIKTNLFTNGDEFVTNLNNANSSYKGYYWKTSSGKYYTGKNPQSISIEELFIIPDVEQSISQLPNIGTSNNISNVTVFDGNPNVGNYLNLKKINPSSANFLPYYNPQFPTQQDYQVGEFRRFFCKKTNEIMYIEIDITQYKNLITKNPQILWQLYQPFNISWQLTGDRQKVAQVNRNMVELASKNQQLPYLNLYLKEDYTKYYQ
jgi:hypothetical protein